jgi:hypothetical protein
MPQHLFNRSWTSSERIRQGPEKGEAIDPVTQLRLTMDVGERPRAPGVLQPVAQRCTPDGAPLWLTDGGQASPRPC